MVFAGHGFVPSPTANKNFLPAVCGTLAGNLLLAKLRNFPARFCTNWVTLVNCVALKGGREGWKRVRLWREALEWVSGRWYWRIPAVVVLSAVPWPVK